MNTVKEAPVKDAQAKSLKMVKNENPIVIEEKTTTEESSKAEVKKFLEAHKPEPPKSAESRIERMKQFEALSNRYGLLKGKDNELKTFEAGNDKLGAKVVFKNAQGFEFSVQNSNVIEKLIEAGRKELSILLAEAENEVLTFEI